MFFSSFFRATNEHESVSDRVDLKVEKAEEVEQCIDKPSFARCDLIVKAKYCNKNCLSLQSSACFIAWSSSVHKMVHTLDGSSNYDAHVWSYFGYMN